MSAAKVAADFLFWMMLGRIALQLVSLGRRTVISDAFRLATYPAFWAVRRITPSSVGDGHIPFLSLPLLLALVILLAPR
jgi:hypothetical protein